MAAAIIYCRLSKNDGTKTVNLETQEKLSRDLCTARGLTVARVIVDDDRSAYNRKVIRHGFEELVAALKNAEVDAIVAYHVNRLYRRISDLDRLAEIIEVTGSEVHTVAAGTVDLSTAIGRQVARIMGAISQGESELIGERVRMKHDQLAADGKAPGGRAPYGYQWAATITVGGTVERGYAVCDKEADVVRRIAALILDGRSCLSVARQLIAEGIPTREGRPWHSTTVRAVVVNPAVANLRVHRRQVAGPGTWTPILDRDLWEQVRGTLQDPSRKRTRPATKHLLSGLVVNPLGEQMNGSRDKTGRAIYATRFEQGTPVAQSMQVGAAELEEMVIGQVLAVFDKATLPTPAGPADAGTGGEITRLEAELAELAVLRGAGEISLAEWMAARRPLQARLETAKKAAGTPRRAPRNVGLLAEPGAVRRAWPTLDLGDRREILGLVVDRVVISPATRGRWTDLAERVQVVWKA
jgi:DNA invertase Pin-like site-specific DNA recombinase